MPGARQNILSAPQKHPMPKTACSVPSEGGDRCPEHGAFRERGWASRDREASSAVGMAADLRVKSMGVRYLSAVRQDDAVSVGGWIDYCS
jgi:hypothetical protein